MAAIGHIMNTTANAIRRAYEEDHDEGHRPHLGASLLGRECERQLWYILHWAHQKKHDGRMLRLFETGHLAEARMAGNLRRIGVQLHTADPAGKQWRVHIAGLGKHAGGSMDGAGLGFPEGPKTWAVWECKTSNTKNFKAIKEKGVRVGKPEHFIQANTYMGETGMHRCLYTVICKETDEVFSEWLHFDELEFARTRAKAERIVKSAEPPDRCGNGQPDWYACKMCDFAAVCHGTETPEINCRTCAHSTPDLVNEPAEADVGGTWRCAKYGNNAIPLDSQRTGCGAGHRYIPIFLEKTAKQVDYVAERDGVVYETPDGRRFENADGAAGSFTSEEIRTCGGKETLPDMAAIKATVPHVTTTRVVA